MVLVQKKIWIRKALIKKNILKIKQKDKILLATNTKMEKEFTSLKS